MAEQRASAFPPLLEAVLDRLREVSPTSLLAILATHGLHTGVSAQGVLSSHGMIPRFEQHHLELLQALALTLPLEQWGETPALPPAVQGTIDAVQALAEAFHQRRFLQMQEDLDDAARTTVSLQERLRLHTQGVRNFSYFGDVVRLSRALYAPLDPVLRSANGFGASDLIDIAHALILEVERRNCLRFTQIRKVFRARSVRQLVRQFVDAYPDLGLEADSLLAAIPKDADRDAVGAYLFGGADVTLAMQYRFTLEEVAQASRADPSCVEAVLDFLALPISGLAEQNTERLFLDNPVWTAPIIKLELGYFCAAPQVVFSFIHEVVGRMVRAADAAKALKDRRTRFLEDELAATLQDAFPTDRVWRSQKWSLDGVQYETDVVLRLDRTVVIAEAKSASLTAAGLRGAPDRLKRHVRELILDPSEQSLRLEGLIKAARGGDVAAAKALAPFEGGLDGVDQVVRLSVTLDDFSTLSSMERELKTVGWIPPDHDLPCTLHIADLQCVITILPDPAHRLHYFVERARVQKRLRIVADEMDFLGFYLESSFQVAPFEDGQTSLTITGMSETVDRFFNSRDAGVTIPKPRVKARPYFTKLLDALQTRRPPGWLTLTTELLRAVGYDEQRTLENQLDKVRREVERRWRGDDHISTLLLTPPPRRDTAVIFYIYPPQLAGERRRNAEDQAARAMALSKRRRCVVISRNTGDWDRAYSHIALAHLAEEMSAEL